MSARSTLVPSLSASYLTWPWCLEGGYNFGILRPEIRSFVFWENLRTPKSPLEIIWPLAHLNYFLAQFKISYLQGSTFKVIIVNNFEPAQSFDEKSAEKFQSKSTNGSRRLPLTKVFSLAWLVGREETKRLWLKLVILLRIVILKLFFCKMYNFPARISKILTTF